MLEILAPLTPEYTLIIPEEPGVLVGWAIGLLGIILLGIYLDDRSFRFDRQTLLWLAVLSVLILIFTPVLGFLPRMSPLMGLGEAPIQHLMFFAAIPWMVAGGILGVLPATFLAGLSGLLLAYLDTHNIFTPLIFMGIAVVFSWCVRQRYYVTLFKWLRFPVVGAFASVFLAAPLVFVTLGLSAPGLTAMRVSLAIEHFPVVMFSLGGMVLVGGVACMIVQAVASQYWGLKTPLRSSPIEHQFKNRLLAYTGPIYLIVLGLVFFSTWSVARDRAQKMLLQQLTGTARMGAESLSVFLESGENIIFDLAQEPQLNATALEEVISVMGQKQQNPTFFDRITLFDAEGMPIATFPQGVIEESFTEVDGLVPLDDSEDLTEPQIMVRMSPREDLTTQVVFMIGIKGPYGRQQRVLLGETVLEENLFASSFLKAMDELEQAGGFGGIVGSDGSLVYPSNYSSDVGAFPDSTPSTATFFQNTTVDGQVLAHYYQPVERTGWGIMATLPEWPSLQMAWETTYPVILITAGVMVLITLGMWVGVSPITREMDTMAAAIDAVAEGDFSLEQLKTPSTSGPGYFRAAFSKMITRQQQRMDKQAQLLSVSGRIAGQLNFKDSLHIILAAALSYGASSARIVLTDSAASGSPDDSDHRVGMGQSTRKLASLDLPVLALSQKTGQMVLTGHEIAQHLPTAKEMTDFNAVAILPLKWNDLGLGVFWVAFPSSQIPTLDVINYLKELAKMGSMAIVNAKTYEDSQNSLGLMETVFELLPDAVLITDQHGQVLFHNQHAGEILGVDNRLLEGKPLSTLFGAEDSVQLSGEQPFRNETRKVQFKNGKAFNLIKSSIRVNPRLVGQVMIFKDVTQQVQEDSLKSEYVTTVSHELRSPLSLILGYAKILRLTGNLNDQQDVYLAKIIAGVEEMKSLVQKLLDIGRLEGGDALNISKFTVEEIITRVIESMEAHAKQKNIHISTNLPNFPLTLEGDQTFITQALKNLLENAIKFSKMEGEVILSANQKGERVIFAVQDKGIGIAPLDQRNLFQKFSRANAHTGIEAEGSGLGLAIVKTIAERHGGRVWLESQLGKGSTFYIEIPRQQP